jgi:hypothetical protein
MNRWSADSSQEGAMRNRTEWLREKRVRCEERMDTLFAPQYDAHWGHINATHHRMLGQFLMRHAARENTGRC